MFEHQQWVCNDNSVKGETLNIRFLSHSAHLMFEQQHWVCNDNSVTDETVSTSDSYHTLLT